METLIFWALPVLLTLIGLKKPLVTGWKLLLSAATALYLGLWLAPAWWGLLDFFPAEAEPYRKGVAVALGCVALFILLYQIARAQLQGGDDDAFVFPVVPERILNALCRFGFGICVSAFLMTLCCATPLRMATRNDGGGFEDKATSALLRITGIADSLTHCLPTVPRAEALKEFWYVPPKPEEKKDSAPKQEESAKNSVPGTGSTTSAIPGEREAEKRAESYTSRIMSMPANIR